MPDYMAHGYSVSLKVLPEMMAGRDDFTSPLCDQCGGSFRRGDFRCVCLRRSNLRRPRGRKDRIVGRALQEPLHVVLIGGNRLRGFFPAPNSEREDDCPDAELIAIADQDLAVDALAIDERAVAAAQVANSDAPGPGHDGAV